MDLKTAEHPGRTELMLGKIAAILKAVNGVDNDGFGELVGYSPQAYSPSPEEQKELDSAWFGYWENRVKAGR